MLLDAQRSVLIVIDLQKKLVPAIDKGDQVVANAGILLEGAGRLGVPVIVSEQYPKGLGLTVDAIAAKLPNDAKTIAKLTFSAARSEDFCRDLSALRAGGGGARSDGDLRHRNACLCFTDGGGSIGRRITGLSRHRRQRLARRRKPPRRCRANGRFRGAMRNQRNGPIRMAGSCRQR